MYPCKTPHRHKHSDALDEIDGWVKWLQQQGATQIVLMGHSRGGNQTAWYAAERAAPPVERLILIAPSTWQAERQAQQYQQRFGKPLGPIRDRAKTMIDRGEAQQLLQPVDFLYCQGTSASAEAVVDYYALEPRMDTPALLSEVRLPVLVFAGSEDRVVSGLAQAMAALADDDRIRLEVLDGADHFFRDLHLEDLVEMSVEFIERH